MKKRNFKIIASMRTRYVIDKLRLLSVCANSKVYDYDKDQVDKIFKAIRRELRLAEKRFRLDLERNPKFTFNEN